MKQYQLFDPLMQGMVSTLAPTDPHVESQDVGRLQSQTERILARLKRGRASNFELQKIALKYGGRISDLRKLGFPIEGTRDPHDRRKWWYELIE